MKKGKTIKEIADEIGVSKQAVRKEIANLGLQTSLQKIGNQFALTEKQENLIKSTFNKRKTQTENANQTKTKRKPVDTEIIELLQQNIIVLQGQLITKDKQIEELNNRLAEAQQIINNTQELHKADKVQQMLLTDGEQPQKKKWWKRK